MKSDQVLREELSALLTGGNAHMGFAEAIAGFPIGEINAKVPNGNYRMWHLLEHMRIVQWDILEFVRDPKHVSPEFPHGYWPRPDEKATPAKWKKTVQRFRADMKALEEIVRNPRTDFFGPIPHAKEYSVFREILLAADHNAYHIGEFSSLRGALNLNPVEG